MKTALAVIIALASAVAAHAGDGMPSQQTLAAMGLSDLVILSDAEAQTIRGSGFKLIEKLAGLESFRQNQQAFRARTAEFRSKLTDHTFSGAASFADSKAAFQAHVQEFKSKVH